jgi:hypothetical protein
MKKGILLVAGLFIGLLAFAQEVATTEGESNEGNVTISGFTDVYYSYNTNTPGMLGSWGTNGVGRIFDGEHNQIAFNMLQTKVTYESDRFQVVGDLLFGPGAELANFGNAGSAVLIKQAYLAYSFCDKFTFTVGQFGTHIGYELVDAPDNFNYSLSYLFGNGPFYHTGAKLDYAASDKIGFMVGVLNGWDNLIDNNLGKSYALQVSLTPNDDVGIYLNWIGGDEDASVITGDTLSSFKHMTDLTATFAVSDKMNVGVNAAFGVYDFEGMKTVNWGGAALYLNYTLCDYFALGLRAEYFDDVGGAQYVGAAYTGYTLTGVITAANGHFLIKPEIRFDSSNSEIYFKDDAGALTDSQMTAGLAFIGKF